MYLNEVITFTMSMPLGSKTHNLTQRPWYQEIKWEGSNRGAGMVSILPQLDFLPCLYGKLNT